MAREKTPQERFSNFFLIAVLIGILYLCFLLLRPFLVEIALAAILVTIFYPLYLKLLLYTRGRISLSALLICVGIVLVVVVPISYFILYLAQQAIAAYNGIAAWQADIIRFVDQYIVQNFRIINKNVVDVRQLVTGVVTTAQSIVIPAATTLVRSTSQFFISLFLIVITMFFMFRDGREGLTKVMRLTPLSNKYDKLIWIKFRDVSASVIVSTFVTALAQGVVGGIGFAIAGLPGLLFGVLVACFSLVPYIGSLIVWGPTAVYLLLTGHVWQGLFLALWGMLAIGLVDNVIRPILIHGKAEVHPMIIFFSIIGGLSLFGYWGVFFGPLIVSLTVTILHIYELQYSHLLDGNTSEQ